MNHLDVVASTLVTNPFTARLVIALGGNALEDVLDVRPRLLVTTRHQRGAISSTLLTTGDTGADKQETLRLELLCAADGVGVVRVATVDDDVACLEMGNKLFDEVIYGLTGFYEEDDFAGFLELRDEFFDGERANDVCS